MRASHPSDAFEFAIAARSRHQHLTQGPHMPNGSHFHGPFPTCLVTVNRGDAKPPILSGRASGEALPGTWVLSASCYPGLACLWLSACLFPHPSAGLDRHSDVLSSSERREPEFEGTWCLLVPTCWDGTETLASCRERELVSGVGVVATRGGFGSACGSCLERLALVCSAVSSSVDVSDGSSWSADSDVRLSVNTVDGLSAGA